MRLALLALLLAGASFTPVGANPALDAARALLPGVYTNEEQLYFAGEAGGPKPPWVGLSIVAEADGLRLRTVDMFGKAGAEDQRMTLAADGDGVAVTTGRCIRLYSLKDGALALSGSRGECRAPASIGGFGPAGIALGMADGAFIDLRRARAFRCWASIPRAAKKADPGSGAGAGGSEDWWFKSGLMLHDQGGRVLAETDDAEPRRFVLRMRNVVWPTGTNQPSLVLYVHRPEEPDKAISYSWADPEAKRVGINLRVMQASCSLVK
ncbi:hypothetical protein [Sandaracinobacteroides saxicola]|uniref:Uncharacterized protein n=1 Tax=Sandaracinobacteroides saxicola TaxID=2759707 RepID=A0A7G5ILC3_9SPHN|nr:hypothetical protein [Sandaracinobacteroides saxicola]QMW24165.1 hypothetical protein H3309_06840 [Sandaracinobacteroides saxicola]